MALLHRTKLIGPYPRMQAKDSAALHSLSEATKETGGGASVGDLPLEDGRNIMFLNTKGSEGEVSPDLAELFSYINGGASSIGVEDGGELVKLVDGYVRRYNTSGSWRKEYMKLEFMLRDRYRDGEAAGMSKGIADEKRRIAKEMSSNGISPSVIASCTSLSMDEIDRILKD